MGTRFVSSAESPVHANYKQAIVDADDTGTVMLNRKSTPCGRALRTECAKEIDRQGGFDRAIFGSVKAVYFGGHKEASLALAGQTVGLIHEVLPVPTSSPAPSKVFTPSDESNGCVRPAASSELQCDGIPLLN
jgi:enoyl-[acyl-carrier protein] reductase II